MLSQSLFPNMPLHAYILPLATTVSCIGLVLIFQSVRSFVYLCVGRRNDVTTNMAALSACMCLAASRLLAVLSRLGLPGATRTCAEDYCYRLMRGNCSGYRCVGIFVSLFGYFSCQRSGLLKALFLSRIKILRRTLAWIRHCLID